MSRPSRPIHGKQIPAMWDGQFYDYVGQELISVSGAASLKIHDGRYNIHVDKPVPPPPQAASEEKTVYFCEVTSVDEEGEYTVRLYEDKTQSSVGTGTLQLCMCHPMDRLEVGDWLLGTETNLTEIVISEGT